MPANRPFDAVLFDLDGTLLETAPEIGAAVSLAIAEQGLPTVDSAEVRFFIGHGVRQTIAKAYDTVAAAGTSAEVKGRHSLPGLKVKLAKRRPPRLASRRS